MLKQKLFKLVSEKVYTCASLPVSDCGSLCTVKACHLESILQQCSSNVRNNSVKTAAHDAFFSGFFIFFFYRQRLLLQRPEATLRKSSPPQRTPALRKRPLTTWRTVLRGRVRCASTHPHASVSMMLQNTFILSRVKMQKIPSCMWLRLQTLEFPATLKA